MKDRYLPVFLLFLVTGTSLHGQMRINGTVVSKGENEGLPGASVVEKGTTNGAVTDLEGRFTLAVTGENSILLFSFVGYKLQEVPLNGLEYVKVELKPDCHRDWFDAQQIAIYANSGVINTPFGGQLELSFPAFFKQATFKNAISYQSNFNEKQLLNAQVGLHHLAVHCSFDADVNWYYRKVSWDNQMTSKAFSIEINLNFRKLRFIVGYSKIDQMKKESAGNRTGSGGMFGIGTWLGRPFNLLILAKVSLYKDLFEYQGELKKRFRSVNTFVKFYKIDSFNELSVGIGYNFTYRFKKQKR